MKKIIIFVLLLFILTPCPAYAEEFNDISQQYIESSAEYGLENFNVSEEITQPSGFLKKIALAITKTVGGEYKNNIKSFILIIFICIIISLVNSFTISMPLKDITQYASVIMCSLTIAQWFKTIYDVGFNVIHNLADYMNLSFPAITVLLSGCGYESGSVLINSIFVFVSNILAILINKITMPVIYAGSILAISNGICNSTEIDKIIKSFIKFAKYSIGLFLTVFTAVLTLTGFTAGKADTVILKTAKYAISNFVPVVGGCLSDTLNSIILTSSLTKNSTGYVGIITLVIIFAVPIVKVYFWVFITKMLSLITSVLKNEKLSNLLETISEITALLGAIIIFITIIYIIMFGIVISIGG